MNLDAVFIQNLTSIVVALGIGSILGAWVTHRLEQNAENRRKVREAKEQQYKSLLT